MPIPSALKTSPDSSRVRAATNFGGLGLPSLYLLAFVLCGWLILVGNLFPLAQTTEGIVPVVDDLAGLTASTLLLAIIALTPIVVRRVFASTRIPR